MCDGRRKERWSKQVQVNLSRCRRKVESRLLCGCMQFHALQPTIWTKSTPRALHLGLRPGWRHCCLFDFHLPRHQHSQLSVAKTSLIRYPPQHQLLPSQKTKPRSKQKASSSHPASLNPFSTLDPRHHVSRRRPRSSQQDPPSRTRTRYFLPPALHHIPV